MADSHLARLLRNALRNIYWSPAKLNAVYRHRKCSQEKSISSQRQCMLETKCNATRGGDEAAARNNSCEILHLLLLAVLVKLKETESKSSKRQCRTRT
jgi:hypothetical protein